MVNRPLFALFGALISSFIALIIWLLQIQLPDNTGFLSLFGTTQNIDVLIVQSYTLPRIIMALLAGGTLGFASLLLQQIMNNDLASDNTLGISSGAQFFLFLTALFAPSALEYGNTVIALAGAIFSLILVLCLAWRKSMSPLLLILSGLVVNLYLGSFSSMMMLFYPEESRGLAQWGAGSLVQQSWRDSQILFLNALPCLAVIFFLIRPLSILSLNESNAKSLGVPVTKLRLIGILLSAYLIASVVSAVGMLGFIGLAASTLIRQLSVRTLKGQLIGSFLIGALLLSVTDLALQILSETQQINLPTGAVTALLGTPLLLWLMFRTIGQVGRITETTTPKPKNAPKWLPYALVFGLMISFVIALGLGQSSFNQWQFTSDIIALRLPRLFIAMSVGILLAVSGVILQRLTLNPMASPELLGVSSGTTMGILVVVFSVTSTDPTLFLIAGIIGATVALFVLYGLNQRNGMLPEKVLLTGISLSALFTTLQTIVIASGDPRATLLISLTSGSTQSLAGQYAIPFFILSLCLLAVSFIFQRWLALFGLQATIAQSLGLNLKKARLILIIFSAILTALATLIIGPLSFIGLLVPHLTRFLGITKIPHQLAISALLGSLVMLLADWFGRQVLFPYEIPAGLVATLIGGTYFLFTVRKV